MNKKKLLSFPNILSMNKKKLLSFPYILWMIGFIIIPLLMVLFYGLTNKDGRFTLDNILLIFSPINRRALWLSLELSVVSTIICLLLAYPVAMILTGLKLKNKSFIIFIFIMPMWINFLLRTLAWQNILENTGILNNVLQFFGLPKLDIINTPTAIVIGMVYNFLPFMILPIYNVLIKISDDTINAARDLGANSFTTFIKIIFPLSLPGMVSGITMVFVPSLTTFVISDILGGSKIVLIGNVIEQQYKMVNNWHSGSGLSIVLMIFIFISMALINKYDKEAEGQSLW